MFHLHTDDARRVLSTARKRAAQFHRDTVGIECLLLALIEYGGGPVEETFFALNIYPGDALKTLESLIEAGVPSNAAAPLTAVPYSPGPRQAIGLALDERRKLAHNYVGSAHILLAVLRYLDDPWVEPEPASQFLECLGIEIKILRQELLSRIPTDTD